MWFGMEALSIVLNINAEINQSLGDSPQDGAEYAFVSKSSKPLFFSKRTWKTAGHGGSGFGPYRECAGTGW